MGQLIQFPSGCLITHRAPSIDEAPEMPADKRRGARKRALPANVTPIRPWGRIPKANRPEDDGAKWTADLVRHYRQRAYELAQTEPNSERQRLVEHMAGISEKLPCNNLRLLTTGEDIVQGIWKAWRRVTAACLEWELADHRRLDACRDGDGEGKSQWTAREKEAEAKVWREYERLVHVPAGGLTDFKTYKLDRRFRRGVGSLDWMRKHKPELAALLDEEHARLTAANETRKALRAAKKREARA